MGRTTALPKQLRAAREALQLTQAEVAQALGVHRPTISEIEAGRRAVTSDELYEFARIYAVPVHVLLSEPLPDQEDVERVLFRRAGKLTTQVRTAVRRFIERCKTEMELEQLLGIERPQDERPGYLVRPPGNRGEAIRQGERIAQQERSRLAVGEQPLRNAIALLERQGVRVGSLDLKQDEDLDGVYFETDALGAAIGINPRRDEWTGFRSAFTAAHEYSHWLLRDVTVEEYRFKEAVANLLEVRANAFAAALLMPEQGLRAYFNDHGLLSEPELIEHLAPGDLVRAMDYFGVSRIALLYRLQNIGLLESEKAEELRAAEFPITKTARALGIRFRRDRSLGTRLPALAVEAWRRGLISTGRAADILDLDIQTFRQRMRTIGEQLEQAQEPLLGAAAGR
jgi:Zn-dependent peptidase ImmA (M78 family)/DNA-binding XRE family transcriptional regulator